MGHLGQILLDSYDCTRSAILCLHLQDPASDFTIPWRLRADSPGTGSGMDTGKSPVQLSRAFFLLSLRSRVCQSQSEVAPAVEKFCRAVAQPYQRVPNGHAIPPMIESRSAPIDDFAPGRRGCGAAVGKHATRRRRTRLPTGRLEAVVLANGCSGGTSALIGRRQGFSCSGSGRFISELRIVSDGRHNSSRRCFLPCCLLCSARVASDTNSPPPSPATTNDTRATAASLSQPAVCHTIITALSCDIDCRADSGTLG